MSGLEIEFAQATDPGKIRQNNEDYSGYVRPETPAQLQSHGWLFALADGVGGQELGEIASRTAVDSMVANFRNSSGGEAHVPLLRRLVQAANHDVYEAGRGAGPGGVAIATTIVACSLRYDRAAIAHVGDSRCYLVRGGQARLLTRDHTVPAEQVRMGILSPREGAESTQRNLLSRSLGNDLFVSVDIADQLLSAGDVFVLCSDGFYASMEESDLVRLLAPDAALASAARALVELARERDGQDNITLQAIRVRAVERMGIYRGRPYKLR
ncbi:MAG: serine/threonine-protein phosphatase [Acidobacteriota bacterium]|nr:serine/threonine-protein phosphatase [Acidobacteriota bacterium]